MATQSRMRACTMPIQAGEVWLANIPFTDGSASKIRPVLVLWLDGADAVVSVITSAAPRTPTDVVLVDWQASGLRVPSTVRLARLDCILAISPAWQPFSNRLATSENRLG